MLLLQLLLLLTAAGTAVTVCAVVQQIALACHSNVLLVFSMLLLAWWVLDTFYMYTRTTYLVEEAQVSHSQ
jgi:hypothetical protein